MPAAIEMPIMGKHVIMLAAVGIVAAEVRATAAAAAVAVVIGVLVGGD